MKHTTHDIDWTDCFSSYYELGDMTRGILRNCAVIRLQEYGFEEIGTSDVNHSLFGIWNSANKNWETALRIQLDEYINANFRK